jgi:hypothetical protein
MRTGGQQRNREPVAVSGQRAVLFLSSSSRRSSIVDEQSSDLRPE